MHILWLSVTLVLGLACGNDDGGSGGAADAAPAVDAGGPAASFTLLDPDVCDPTTATFTLDIANPYHPLPVGQRLVLEGEEDGAALRVEITVLDETETVAGVQTRVVTEEEYENDELVEVSRNFFAQTSDGTVCYFGEDVDDYEDGVVVGHGGAWRAGDGGASPGILMPGTPEAGTKFAQEDAPGIAEDMSAIIDVAGSITVPAGTYDDTVEALDWNPLEGHTSADGETKIYASGVGLVVDDVIQLTTFTPGS